MPKRRKLTSLFYPPSLQDQSRRGTSFRLGSYLAIHLLQIAAMRYGALILPHLIHPRVGGDPVVNAATLEGPSLGQYSKYVDVDVYPVMAISGTDPSQGRVGFYLQSY